MRTLGAVVILAATAVQAEVSPPTGRDIYVLGEVHDNPAHHQEQARLVGLIRPRAVVWEMLAPSQVMALEGVDPDDASAMESALSWAKSGWPDFAMYHPVFVAAGSARHFGAQAPRDALRKAMQEGLTEVIGGKEVARWSLGPLEAADQAAREAEQAAAHCDALPTDLLPGMVEAQRLRDWYLANEAVTAVEAGYAPVVVITGTGHARTDTGVPALIAAARPDLEVWSLGQTESVSPAPDADAPFDAVNVTPPVERADPCLALRSLN